MVEISVTEFARNLRKIFDRIERDGQEIILIRNRRGIARIIPGLPQMTAKEAMGDLYRTLPEDDGENWLKDSQMKGTLNSELKNNPWES